MGAILEKNRLLTLTTSKEKFTKICMKNVSIFPRDIDWREEVLEVASAKYIYEYHKDLFVIDNQNTFHKIENVFIIGSNKIFVKCREVQSTYVTFFAAFEVLAISDQMTIIDVSQLNNKESFAQIKPYERDNAFILCKRNVI